MEHRRYFMELSYNGSAYHGWQIQNNAHTVQQELEEALSRILREKIAITGCGRTDTGVNARHFIAHFDSQNLNEFGPDHLTFKLNRYLRENVVIHSIKQVKSDAHSRFDARSRTYRYYVTREKDPFLKDFAFYLFGELDVNAMNQAAQVLFEYIDFTSFSKLHTQVKTNNCKIKHAQWEEKGELLVFTITADRFLRNMVRAIVGTLLEVGLGKLSIDGFREIIELKDRCEAGVSVPGEALFLEEITYPDHIYL